MSDDRLEVAVDVVARWLLARAAENVAEEDWDLVPEVGEHDWNRIGERLKTVAPWPDPETYRAAYEFLESRAESGALDEGPS